MQKSISDLSSNPKGTSIGEASLEFLRNDVERRSVQHRESINATQTIAEHTRLQVSAAEAAIADLRTEFGAERERQGLKADSIKALLSEFRQELNKLQVSQ